MEDHEDWSNCSLGERLVHKSWKARSSAYEEIGKKCSCFEENDFLKYSEDLKRMVSDANQVAQEAGLSTIVQFLTHAPAPLSIKCTKNTIVPLIVSKTFGSSRAGTKNMALEVLMCYVELDHSDYVINETILGLDHKTPKNVLFAVYALKEIVRVFGVPTINLKTILKQLGKIFDHKDVAVRNMGTELAVEIYKWIGPAISNCIANLKPIQLKELNQVFENSSHGAQKAIRFTRSNRNDSSTPTLGKSLTQETLVAAEESDPEQFDTNSLIDPVNVLDKLPKNLYDNMTDQKWKIRKEALDNLLEILSVPKYSDGKYGELIGSLGKRMNDSNILVVSLAVNCIEKIALGLNSSFSQYKSSIFSLVVDRLKEKKSQVVEAIKSALDAIFKAVPDLTIFMDDFTTGFSHKNPQVRTEIIKWMSRCLRKSKQLLNKAEIKLLANSFLKGMDDGADIIREASAEAMGNLMKLVSEKSLYPYMEKLDKIKEAKVRDYYQKVKNCVSAVSSEVTTVAKNPSKIHSTVKLSKASTQKNETKSKPVMKKALNIVDKPTSSSSKADPIKFVYTNESAVDCIRQSPLAEYSEPLKDSNWKLRLEALNLFYEKIKNDSEMDLHGEVIVRFLGISPGWKESNFQILNLMMNVIQILADSKDSFTKASASLVLPVLFEKLSDVKLRKMAVGALGAIIKSTSIQFVFSQMHASVHSLKNPKALCELFIWMKESLLEFGLKNVDQAALVDSLKRGFLNSNQAVRTAATAAFGILNSLSKNDLLILVNDISPQMIQLLKTECETAKNCTQAKCSETAKLSLDESSMKVENIELQDISALISHELIENMNDSNWKIRKAALDDLLNILKGIKSIIKPNLDNDLYAALKLRLTDSNKNLVMEAVEIIGELANAMGPSFEKPLKILLGPVLSTLTDPKPQVRQNIIQSLTKIRDSVGLQLVIPVISNTLMTDHFTLRKDLLQWLNDQKNTDFSTLDYQLLIHPVFLCLQDRNTDVRKLSQELFNLMGIKVGAEVLREKANDLFRGAALASITPFLENVKPLQAIKNIPEKIESVSKSNKPKNQKLRAAVENVKTLPKGPSLESLDSVFCNILACDLKMKEQRANSDKGILKWNFDLPRKDLTDHLMEQCSLVLSPDLLSLLFSTEHYKEKDHINGLNRLCDELQNRNSSINDNHLTSPELKQRYLSCSDLLLKYVTIRFFDTNTSILLKVLEFLELLFTTMEEEGYLLSDYEASCFLPFLINKVGDNKETLRSKVRELIKWLSRLYPASKLFLYVMKGLDSKNSRTRTESLDELAYLIQRNGISVCVPAKVFPLITQQVGDRDPGVRNAALSVIIQAYSLVGENIYKFLGRPSEKDRSLIEEKIKRCAPGVEIVQEILPKKETKRCSTPVRKCEPILKIADELPLKVFSLDLELIEGDLKLSASKSNGASIESSKNSLVSLVDQIDIRNPQESMLIVKKIEDQLSRDPESMIGCANNVVGTLTKYVNTLFSSSELPKADGARFGKHLLNAMILIFSSAPLSKNLERDVLYNCLDVALIHLLDPSVTSLEQGVHLSKMMNILMVRALQNIHPNFAFSIMLEILGISAQKMLDLSGNDLIRQSKHTELVMKCTWKLIKTIPQMLQENSLDIPPLLLDVHNFLVRTPPLEWKRRSSLSIPQADMPLRTVKTILSIILNNIDHNNSHAVQYLKQMSDSSKKENSLSVNESKSRLSVIFDKISNKEETKMGIQELYEFQKNHPNAGYLIEERLSQTGAYFQGYIRRGLNHLKESESSVSDLVKSSSYDPNLAQTMNMSSSMQNLSKSNLVTADNATSVIISKEINQSENAALPAMDRSLAVAELKERLAKMKLNMQNKMQAYKTAIAEMTILRNSLMKLSKELVSTELELGCIGPGEVSLYLGDNWFVSVQKADALNIIKRRIEFLDSQISNLQFAALKSEMSEFVDIVETDDVSSQYIMPSDNKFCNQEKNVGEFEKNLFELLNQLEDQELSDQTHDSINSNDEQGSQNDSFSDKSHQESHQSQESLQGSDTEIPEKKVHFAPGTKCEESSKTQAPKRPIKDFIVEREIDSFDDDSDLEDYHVGREISREYIAFRDKIEISNQQLQYQGRGLDKFQPKVSKFKSRSLEAKEI